MDDGTKDKYIPLDKSWIIRMGVLDLVNGYKDINSFLANEKNLGNDLLALKSAIEAWNPNQLIHVGESGTLYRFLKFISWKLKLNKKFVISGTLKNREMSDTPAIIGMSQTEPLKLDNGTSQWASASALSGDKERLKNPPYKLVVTYKAIEHWNSQRQKGEIWTPRYDETILAQAEAFLEILKKNKIKFFPQQAEDYCFAFTFGYISKKEGEKQWPSLRNHESDRIKEMSKVLERAAKGEEILSRDHRVVQAVAMLGQAKNKKLKILYPEAVNKSWPQFWEFLEFAAGAKTQ